jgi:hypothetical protein
MNGMFKNATSFNQDLSDWGPLGAMPSGFDDGADSWVLDRPVWGSCPP